MSKRTLRSSARRRHIRKLMKEFGGRCAWCDRELITRARITGKIISDRASKVVWLKDGVAVLSYLVTVDHLTPLSTGGHNGRWNLVPACFNCNNKRQQPKHASEFLVRESVWRLRERILTGNPPAVTLVL